VVLVSFILITVDYTTGHFIKTYKTEGIVVDKWSKFSSVTINFEITNKYVLVVRMGNTDMLCDVSHSVYRKTKAGYRCEVRKNIGLSGVLYGYTAIRSRPSLNN
jgi:hypothetical protein